MALATLRIDIQSRGNGTNNISRNDARPGDTVSVLLSNPGANPVVEMLWMPKNGTAGSIQTVSGERRYIFAIPNNVVAGTYRFRYKDGGANEVVREVAVLTATKGLRIPALGSQADAAASLISFDASKSENNASYAGDSRLIDTSGYNFAGYTLDIEKLVLTVEDLAANPPPGSVPQDLLDTVAAQDQLLAQHDDQIITARQHADQAIDLANALESRVETLESAPPGGGGEGGGEGDSEAIATLNDAVLDLGNRVGVLEGAAPGGGRSWQVAFDENFLESAAFTFANGDFLFRSAVWKGVRLEKADFAGIIEGEGLVIDHGPLNTGWYHTEDSEPRIQVGLRDLIPDFVLGEDDLRITAQFTVQGTTSYDLGGIAIEKAVFQSGQAWTHKLYAGYNPGAARYGQMLYGAQEGYTVIPTSDNVNRLYLRGINEATYSSRQTSLDASATNDEAFEETDLNIRSYWSLASAMYGASSTYSLTSDNNTLHQVNVPRVKKASELAIVIGAQSGNTNNQCVLRVQRLRIEYRK